MNILPQCSRWLASLFNRHSDRERVRALERGEFAERLTSTDNRPQRPAGQVNSQAFLIELPSYLLAVASGLRVGLSPLAALERSARLLSFDSDLRKEVTELIQALHRGESKDGAIARFAERVRLEELSLFRSALIINWEHGGKLGRTLTQISHSTRERHTLIHTARVTTTVMNMTANVMILLAPILIGVVASRYPNYLEIVSDSPTAATSALIGAFLLVGGLGVLKQMCRFNP